MARRARIAERFDAGMSALDAELAEPPMLDTAPGKWQPDYALLVECVRLSDPRYILVRLNGKEFGVMSHTALATKIRKALRKQTREA